MNNKIKLINNGCNVYVQLDSPKEVESYVTAEYKYCTKEENDYMDARKTEDRIKTKKLLMEKRIDFAKSMGYLN
jgi:hypothetical protein